MSLKKYLTPLYRLPWQWVIVPLAALSMCSLSQVATAQVVSCQLGVYDCAGEVYLKSGNVGIGTTSPGARLDVTASGGTFINVLDTG